MTTDERREPGTSQCVRRHGGGGRTWGLGEELSRKPGFGRLGRRFVECWEGSRVNFHFLEPERREVSLRPRHLPAGWH